MAGKQGGQLAAREIQFRHQGIEIAFPDQPGQMIHGPGGGAVGLCRGVVQDTVAGFHAQFRRRAFVHDLEMRGDPGFQREAAQQAFAERMNGPDVGAVGGVRDLGEQAAHAGQVIAFALRLRQGNTRLVAVAFHQRVVVHHRPFAQQGAQAVGHFRGRRLGIGQAQDVARAHAAHQQADDAVGQNMGLAGPGIGRDPIGFMGPPGGLLGFRRLAAGFAHPLGHAPSPPPFPSPSPPTLLQARTRAKWS